MIQAICSLIGKNCYKPKVICVLLDGQGEGFLGFVALVVICFLLLYMRAKYFENLSSNLTPVGNC